MTLFLTMGAMWAQVTSLEGFSQDKCYTFATSSRGAWAVDAEGTLFSSTGDQGLAEDATDTRQQFAVLSVNEADYYLYSVSAKKFIKADRTLVAGPADALAIADASSQGAGRVQFRFRDVNNSYINLGGSNQMSVDWWGTIDAGNAVLVSEAGDFNAAEALAMLSNVCTVTYEFTYEGEVKYTQELVVAKGDAYPAVQPPFGTVAETPSGTVEEDVTVEVPLTVQLPFIAAADVESIDTWYYVQMHSNNKKYIQYLADQTYIEWADAEMDETAKDSYTWAFVGNVFDGFKVVNKAATIEKALQSTGGGDATMVAYAEGTQFVLAATSETSEGAQGGFCLRYPENNQYLNAQSGKVAHWGSTDAGSTFTVAIVEEEPEVDPNDYTSYIINADLSVDVEKDVADAGNWNTVGTKGVSGGMVKVSSGATFDFSQIIVLPAGQYKMTAQAAYRFGGDEQAEYDAIQADTETHLVKLYAQTATYKYEANVQNRYEGASDTDYAAGSGSVTVNGKFVPNSSSAVQTWFNNGQYVNELVFNVQEDGEIKIGIANVGNNPGGEYTNIGAWTLTRLGDAEADPEVEEPTPDPDPTPDPEETIDMDLTHLVGTSRDAWIGNNGGPVNIDGISLPEKYETTTATLGDVMWQTVTGLENGKYTVELWANARYTSGRGFDSEAADGALDFTYLYANNVEISIEVYHNGGLNSGKSYKLEGVEVTDGTLKMGMTKKAAGSNWHTIQIKSLIYHAPANAALDMAKVDLQAALDAANAVEPKKDDFVAAIAAAQGVYDNSKSVEEIEAATATLLEATKLAILGNASPSNPVLTDFVVNGTFDTNGVVTPWKTTTSAQNQTTATNQQGAFTGNFFENWNPSAVTGKIYQVIENVPNGIYDLSICAFVNNFNGAVQFVYANADKVALTSGEPTAYVVRTIVVNNTIEVGFEQTEAVANWMGIDNVSLTYLGEYSNDAEVNMAKANFTAAYDEFNAALAACQAMMLKTNFYEVADAADQLNAQLESTTDIEALNAMVAQLNEATASLNEINAVYAEYDVYVQKFKAAAEWSEPLTTEAAELLEYNMYGGAGMQAMSIDALKQAIEQIKADYIAYAADAKLYDGNMFDFTYLIQNPNIDTDLAGWTLTGRVGRLNNNGFNGVPGIMEIGEWGATSWEAGVSQTLNELPNGKYIVKAAWMAASGIKMNFSANEASVEVVGIGDQGGNIAADGSVVEMGKGVQGWQYVEVEGIVENGVLTIAATASSAAQYQWSNADAFELYYAGSECLYDLDEPIEGEWEDVTNKPNEYGWTIIDHAELLGLGDYWVATNDTRYDEERGVMEFVAGENAAASLIQEWCPFGQATYRLTGKAFHNGAVNAVMFVGDQTVEIPAAAEGATFENAEEYFTTFSIEFTCESAWGTQLNVGYSCEFDNAEDFLVVGGLKLEEKKSTTIKSIFMETIMALESLGYEVMNMEALYASQQAVMADAMPIYEAIMGGQKVLKSEVEQSIEDMQAIIAELNPVAAYYKGEFMDALYAAEDFKWTLDEASQAYTDLEAAINEANDVAAVTTVAELEAKVAALEELMKLIETGIDSIEAEVETVIYDLSGRRVTEMTKGVYIVNGKKVIKK